MAIHRAEQSARIAASPDGCFRTITDYETFTEWQTAVRAVDVVERYEDGLGEVVDYEVDAKFKVVSYRLRYHYERPGRIWWDFLGGDGVKAIEGEYVFEPDGEGTRAIYRLGIDPGVPVPRIVLGRANALVMKRSVADLRREAERRAGG